MRGANTSIEHPTNALAVSKGPRARHPRTGESTVDSTL